jgi:TrmH family RNA methyltransferase
MQPIKSAQNPGFQKMLSLAKAAKARQTEQLFLAEGPHLAAEAIQHGLAQQVWATPEALASEEASDLTRQAAQAKVPVGEMAASLLDRLCDTRQPQGWVSIVRRPVIKGADLSLWLALDALQDPGNMGTLLRCAWASKAGVIVGPGSTDPWAPKVLRSAAGAHFAVPIQESSDLVSSLKQFKAAGYKLSAADPRGTLSHTKALWTQPTVLVLGAEGAGLSPEALTVCDERVKIEYPGGAESLNAAISGALLLFEALRQRSNN